jgi:hypothetical protein
MNNKDDLGLALHEFGKNLTAMLEFQKMVAELQHERFKHLIASGFSEKQAIEIVSAMNMGNL